MWYFYLLVHEKPPQHLAALNSRHLCYRGFCGVRCGLVGVSQGIQGPLTGFSQDADRDVIRASSQGSAGEVYSQACSHGCCQTQLLTGCWTDWSLSSLLAVVRSSSLPPHRPRHRAAQLTSHQLQKDGPQAEHFRVFSVTNPRSDIHHFPELCLLEMSLWGPAHSQRKGITKVGTPGRGGSLGPSWSCLLQTRTCVVKNELHPRIWGKPLSQLHLSWGNL